MSGPADKPLGLDTSLRSYSAGAGPGSFARVPRLLNAPDKTCTAIFGYPIGGIAVPVDKLGLVVPWMGLVGLAGLAALGVVLVSRHRG